VILSDRTIREELAAGRIVIEPFEPSYVQPSSVDLRLDRLFRVFRNHTTPYIDPKLQQEDLTELVEVEGDEPFVLHPGEFALGSTLERVALPSDLVARLEGKALAVDTEVPTPSGWRTMGDLQAGDVVFDGDGLPTLVVAATPVLHGRPCRRVEFSDGTAIVADAAHQWETVDKNGRRHGRRRAAVRTTDEIAASLVVRGERNHQIALAGAVHQPERDLPVDPYVLGTWLGDGTTKTAAVTSADAFVLDQILAAGHAVKRVGATEYTYRIGGGPADHEHRRDPSTGRYGGDGSLQSTLRAMGVLGNKHIPELYLRASAAQRLALLQGLMDSDGYVDTVGRCDFNSTSERLTEQVFELVAGLGLRPTVARKRAVQRGVDCGPRFEVQFSTDQPVFRLPRKLERLRTTGYFHRFRAVAAVEEIASVPVRCIEVASTRGVFLVTRAHIPTHNSSLGRLGLLIHSTAGFVDAGWDGHLTLELSNVATLPIALYPGMKIGQISFLRMTTPADVPYGADAVGSKYQGQRGPTPSRSWLNFRKG
jgi:deoxycytidine triphosphate deaminase